VAECFDEFGTDDAGHDVLPLLMSEVPFEPEEAASPPEVVAVGLAADEGGGYFVPNFGFGCCPDFETETVCAEAVVGLFPKEEEAGFE